MDLAFRILNVFTVPGTRLSGNPLCVFEDARGLTDAEMQALARQLNLSETTFLLPADGPGATARVRIFTPELEMPFAGHPSLGTAHVVRALRGGAHPVVLQVPAGAVEVRAEGDRYTLRAPQPARWRAAAPAPGAVAAALGLPAEAVAAPLWVDTGVAQLLVPLKDVAALRAARPEARRLAEVAAGGGGGATAYAFAVRGPDELEARCFFVEKGAVVEDPATGSACANLGGWLVATGAALPARRAVHQGEQVGRPSRLLLAVEGAEEIRVTGEVVELGRGTITL
jgi:PhzF family phenazine biosynthesis protein